MMFPGCLHLCKLRHREVTHLRESPEAFCRRSGSGGSISSGKEEREVLKIRRGKIQSQKSLRKGRIIFRKATH